jgi:hypothetical protein
MKKQLQELGRQKALEVMKHRLLSVGRCPECNGKDLWLSRHSWDDESEALCSMCLSRDLQDSEHSGGHSSEWIFQDACRMPNEKSRTYRITMHAYFSRIERGYEPRNRHKETIVNAAFSIAKELTKIYEAVEAYSPNMSTYLGHDEWLCRKYPFTGDLFEFIAEVNAWAEDMNENGDTK